MSQGTQLPIQKQKLNEVQADEVPAEKSVTMIESNKKEIENPLPIEKDGKTENVDSQGKEHDIQEQTKEKPVQNTAEPVEIKEGELTETQKPAREIAVEDAPNEVTEPEQSKPKSTTVSAEPSSAAVKANTTKGEDQKTDEGFKNTYLNKFPLDQPKSVEDENNDTIDSSIVANAEEDNDDVNSVGTGNLTQGSITEDLTPLSSGEVPSSLQIKTSDLQSADLQSAELASPSPKPSTPKKKLTMQERLAMAVKSDKKSKKGKKSKKVKKSVLASGIANESNSSVTLSDAKSDTNSSVVMPKTSIEIDSNLEITDIKDTKIAPLPKKKGSEPPSNQEAPKEAGEPSAVKETIEAKPEIANAKAGTTLVEESTETPAPEEGKYENFTKEQLINLLTRSKTAHERQVAELKTKLDFFGKAKEIITSSSTSPSDSSLQLQLKAKDEQIAGLIEEGEKLSMKELKYTALIKQLRSSNLESTGVIQNLRERLGFRESKLDDLETKYQSLKDTHKASEQKLKVFTQVESNYEDLKKRYEKVSAELSEFKFKNYEKKFQELNIKLNEEMAKSNSLKKELESEKIQVSLIKTTAQKEVNNLKSQIEDLKNRLKSSKEDYESEIARLENKVETLRAQAEDSKTRNLSNKADEQLSQQNQALQTKYENTLEQLQDIENSYVSRISQLKETIDGLRANEVKHVKSFKKLMKDYTGLKDEHAKLTEDSSSSEFTINDLQKAIKARDTKITSLNEKYEELLSKHNSIVTDLEDKLKKLDLSNSVEKDIQSPLDKLDDTFDSSLDPFRSIPSSSSHYNMRRSSDLQVPWGRSPEINPHQNFTRSSSILKSSSLQVPQPFSPPFISANGSGSGNNSSSSVLNNMETSSTANGDSVSLNFETLSKFDSISNQNSPFLSTGAGGFNANSSAGPSIQLVGKLSSKIARLETELSTTKEELKKSGKEKVDTGNEILKLMKQIEDLKQFEKQNTALNKDVEDLKKREKVSLELLGEKSEQVEELRNDVADLKDLLRQQVEQMVEMQNRK